MSDLLDDFEIGPTGFIPNYDNHCRVYSRSYELQYVEDGGVFLEYNGQLHKLDRGSIWINHPGIRYEYWPQPEIGWWRHRYIVFSGSICDHWRHYQLLPLEPYQHDPVPDAAARLDRIMECARHPGQPLYRLEAANLLENFLIDLVRENQLIQPEWLSAAMRELEKGPLPDYEKIAASSGMSLRSFLRKFHKYAGCSPHQYFLKSRIQQATRYLETTDLSLKEIATELGFADTAHLVRQYRTLTGMSPGAHRKSHQE